MELKSIATSASPLGENRVRLTGRVAYDDRPGQVEEYWYDVPEAAAGSLSGTGNPWLACLLPLAAKLGEPLRLNLPVDPLLLRNAHEITAIWKSWYPTLHRVEIQADAAERSPGPRVASFFTAGVDSYFTLLRSREANAIPTDDLISVWGFDVYLHHRPAFERRRERLRAIADEFGKTLIDVATNLRETRLETAGWGPLYHGAGLASVGHVLEGRFRRVLIASTWSYGHMVPLGSHPLTDPLFSSSSLGVVHDGATLDRFAKLEYISQHARALRDLHVCFRVASDYNCGECEKCMRTMVVLEVLDRLSGERNFPVDRLEPERLGRTYIKTARVERYYTTIRAHAEARKRTDLVDAIDRALRRSRVIRRLMVIPKWLSGKRGLWRAARPIRRALLNGQIV